MSNLTSNRKRPPISPSIRLLGLTPIKAGTAHMSDRASHDNVAKNRNGTIRPQTGSRRDRSRRCPRRCIPLPSHSWRLGQCSHESASIDQPDALARVGYCSQRNQFAGRSFPLMRPIIGLVALSDERTPDLTEFKRTARPLVSSLAASRRDQASVTPCVAATAPCQLSGSTAHPRDAPIARRDQAISSFAPGAAPLVGDKEAP